MNSFLPMSESIFSLSLVWFERISHLTYGLIGVFITIKFAFLIMQVSPAQSYFDSIKNAASYLGMTLAFPILAKLFVFGASDIADRIFKVASYPKFTGIAEYVEIIFGQFGLIMFVWKIIDLLVLNLAWAFHTVLLSVLIAIAPLIFFGCMMTDFNVGIKPFFTTFVALCAWPIVWNLLGQLGMTTLSNLNSTPLTSICFYFVFHLLQILSPIFCFSLLKNLNLDMGSKFAVKIGGKFGLGI